MLLPLLTSTKVRRVPVVVAVLVIANVAIFLVTHEHIDSAARRWGFTPPDSAGSVGEYLSDPRLLLTVWTHAFLHGGWLHLIGNLWFLCVFGIALESRIGSLRFALLYAIFAGVAVVVHALMQAGPIRPVIGASGAISGLLGCYLILEPRSRVLSIFFVGVPLFLTEVPSLFYVAVWLIIQIDGIQTRFLTGPECANVAWWAHIGGFAAGMAVGGGLCLAREYCGARQRQRGCSDDSDGS